jgi:hypothetical protein
MVSAKAIRLVKDEKDKTNNDTSNVPSKAFLICCLDSLLRGLENRKKEVNLATRQFFRESVVKPRTAAAPSPSHTNGFSII